MLVSERPPVAPATPGPAWALRRMHHTFARDGRAVVVAMDRAVARVLGRTGLILALDSEGPIADYGVEQALRFGADAVELKVFPGNPQETKLADLRRLAARCN